jgi:hypothetical protein
MHQINPVITALTMIKGLGHQLRRKEKEYLRIKSELEHVLLCALVDGSVVRGSEAYTVLSDAIEILNVMAYNEEERYNDNY